MTERLAFDFDFDFILRWDITIGYYILAYFGEDDIWIFMGGLCFCFWEMGALGPHRFFTLAFFCLLLFDLLWQASA